MRHEPSSPRHTRVPLLAGLLILLALVPAVPAAADGGGTLGARGVNERELRAFEARTLGPEHAREHAAGRRALRDPRLRAQMRARRRALARRAPARPRARAANADVGRWGAPLPLPVMGIHAIMLPTGKVLMFAYPENWSRKPSAANAATAYVWDPATGASRRVDPPVDPATGLPVNIWCGGQSFLADGRVLVTGGNLRYQQTGYAYRGLNKVYTFNPFSETWTQQPDMRHGRWYPTQVLQPDGRTLIMSGLDENGQPRRGHDTPLNKDVEVFTPSSDPNGRGTISLASGPAPALKGMYPHTFVMPSGRTLVAGPYAQDSFFMTPDAERTSYAYGDVANLRAEHYWGTAVLMPGSTQVLVVGGSERDADAGATKATELFDEAAPGAGWRAGAPLNTGRAHHNTVILPDRSLATFGGGYGDVGGDQWVSGPEHKTVELYDPASGRWRLGPAQAENRSYHSTAVLLPDGRVMSAGDDVARRHRPRHGRDLRAALPLQGAAADDRERAGERALGRAVRRGHAGRDRERRARGARGGDPRQRHEPAARAPVGHPPRRGPRGRAGRAGERERRAARLLHAVRAERRGRAVGGEVDQARPARAGRRDPGRQRGQGSPGGEGVAGAPVHARHVRPLAAAVEQVGRRHADPPGALRALRRAAARHGTARRGDRATPSPARARVLPPHGLDAWPRADRRDPEGRAADRGRTVPEAVAALGPHAADRSHELALPHADRRAARPRGRGRQRGAPAPGALGVEGVSDCKT